MERNDSSTKILSHINTVILFEKNAEIIKKMRSLCKQNGLYICEVEHPSDLIGVPSFLGIINAGLLNDDEWNSFIDYLKEANNTCFKIFLTDSSTREPRIPAQNAIRQPEKITGDFLKFLILKTRSAIMMKREIEKKSLRRITRLMHIIKILQNGGTLRPKETAKVLEVSKRTVLRDIEILDIAGFIIDRTDNGGYRFPENYNIFDFMYDGIAK